MPQRNHFPVPSVEPTEIWKMPTHQPDSQTLEEKVDRLLVEVSRLNQRLDLIFGGNVLINGRFVDIKKLNTIPKKKLK